MNGKITSVILIPSFDSRVTNQSRSIENPIVMPVSRLINYNFFKDIFFHYLFKREIKHYSDGFKNFKSIWSFASCCKDLYKEVCEYNATLAWLAVGDRKEDARTLTLKQCAATIDRLTIFDKFLIIKGFNTGNPYLEALTSSLCIKIVNYFSSKFCIVNYLDANDNKVFNLLLNSGKANNLINLILTSVCKGPIQTEDFCHSIKNTDKTWNEQFLDLIINLGKTGLEVTHDIHINSNCQRLLHAFFAYRLCNKKRCSHNFRDCKHFSDNKLPPLSDVTSAFIMLFKTGKIDLIGQDIIKHAVLESIFSDDSDFKQSINNLLFQLREMGFFGIKQQKLSLTAMIKNIVRSYAVEFLKNL